jgi:hypothetical protein
MVTMIDAKDIIKSMRPLDMKAFKEAAKLYDCYILVRRSNPASKQFIGRAGYTPKRIDCKFKTADFDFLHQGLQRRLKVAGLVVNPDMDAEFVKAFGAAKYQKAIKIWRKENQSVVSPVTSHDASGKPNYTWIPDNKPYCSCSDEASEHYGCLIFAESTPLSGGKFIHGDYDLYGIVPAADPARNVIVQEKLLGQHHSRGRLFKDVQYFVNRHMGVAMVLHGSQDTYTEDFDDEIDVFYPDGSIKLFSGPSEIAALYETEFGGRRMFTKKASLKTVLGKFAEVVYD